MEESVELANEPVGCILAPSRDAKIESLTGRRKEKV
jgi:hypothetical protein